MASNKRQLQLAVAQSFSLPSGWRIKKIPRRDGSRIDRYFVEPWTGKQFRSLKEVERHLNGDDDDDYIHKPTPTYRKSHQSYGYEGTSYESRVLASGEKSNLAMVAYGGAASMKPFTLPDGWFVEEVPRRLHPQRKKCKWVDKYYHELETGRKFRSMIAVQRYLAEKEENAPLSQAVEQIKENKPLAEIFRLENRYNDCSPKKKNIAGESKQDSSVIAPPMKVNWVIAGPNGDTWNPFVSETLVPDCVKEQWTSRFTIFMNDGKVSVPRACDKTKIF